MEPFQQPTRERAQNGRPSLMAIQASPRKKGFTAQIMEILLEGAKQPSKIFIRAARPSPLKRDTSRPWMSLGI